MSTEQAKMQEVAQATTAATAEIRRLDEYELALKNPKTLAEAVQAALAVEVAERETDVHREIRRERLNIMDDDGDDGEQYYNSAEGEVTEQEDDMLMARRLAEEESLMEFAYIIAEPTNLTPERKFDFEINLESDEPPNERT
eukprot:jgi/Tetstr1/456641/TSEL_043342.t1